MIKQHLFTAKQDHTQIIQPKDCDHFYSWSIRHTEEERRRYQILTDMYDYPTRPLLIHQHRSTEKCTNHEHHLIEAQNAQPAQ